MPTLIQLLTVLFLAFTAVLASPTNAGGPALFTHHAVRSLADDVALPQTNAARLARGLTPSAPKRLFSPTHIRRQTPSTVPSAQPSGLIAVYDTFGGLQGYLNTFGNIVARNSALSFTYKPPASASSPVEINETLNMAKALILLQTFPRLGHEMIGPGSAGYGQIASYSNLHTAANAPSQLLAGRNAESTIFIIDPVTFAISAQWVNSNGVKAPLTFIIGSTISLFATGDYASYQAFYPTPSAPQARLVFVPQ